MLRGIAKRLGLFLAVVWTAATLNFLLPKLVARNPIEARLPEELETSGSLRDIKALVAAYEQTFALDKSIFEQHQARPRSRLDNASLGHSTSR